MTQTFEVMSKDEIRFVHETTAFQKWTESRQLMIDLLAADAPWIHSLPIFACQVVGGDQSRATPVGAAWITLVHAANLIDDVQDGDHRYLTHVQDPRHAITIALSWIFAAFKMIDQPFYNLESQNKITRIFSSLGFDSSLGQFQDLILENSKFDPQRQLEEYWNALIMKSGSIFMAGMEAGAAVGDGSEAELKALGEYGTAVGVIRQVIDDCRDVGNDEKLPGKYHTLPMLLQSMVIDKQVTISQGYTVNNKQEGRTLNHPPQSLLNLGLPEIIIDILFEWRRRALQSLRVLKPSGARNELEKIVDLAMTPKLHSQ